MTSTAAPPTRPKSAPVVLHSKLKVRCFRCGKDDKVKQVGSVFRKGNLIRPIHTYRCLRCNYGFFAQQPLSFTEKTAKESELKESAKLFWVGVTAVVGTEVGLHGHEDCDAPYMHALGPATGVASTAVIQEKNQSAKAIMGFGHIVKDTGSDITDAGLSAIGVLGNFLDGVESVFTAPSGKKFKAVERAVNNTSNAFLEAYAKVGLVPIKLVGRLFGKVW
jgi:hypothetical protein